LFVQIFYDGYRGINVNLITLLSLSITQVTQLKNESSEKEVVNALEHFVNITKEPSSANETLTDGEITSVTKSLETVANLLNISNHLVSDTVVEVKT